MPDSFITLDEAKAHLIVDHDMDDNVITGYIAAALEVAQTHIGKTFGDSLTAETVPFNQSIKIGCLMYVGHLYANREITTDTALHTVPMSISALWSVYREPCLY
ncbi:head-tail connector protein [Testudinibacter sp. P80/BLE/0925]|uniref:head-tail connector protein n=1 Tax=Testudinibacter sp. TW-1 TaxID=3417757 RepID=UPI003D36B27B